MRYAHTLLFVCPDCNLPIAISRISDKKNLEGVDGELVRIKCAYCEQASEVSAVTAKVHWVTDWSDSGPVAAKGSQIAVANLGSGGDHS